MGERPVDGSAEDAGTSGSDEAEGSSESLQSEEGRSEEKQSEEETESGQALEVGQPTAHAGDIVASGTDGGSTWTLDSDVLLTVSGTGDYSNIPERNPNLWWDYRDSIISAKVDVTGMTNVQSMFGGCSSLTSLDSRGFDTSNVTSMFDMFSGCSIMPSLEFRGCATRNET